jgi:hypothetical protein
LNSPSVELRDVLLINDGREAGGGRAVTTRRGGQDGRP